MEGETLHIVLAGHVDHGKSTLVGRLAHALDVLPEGREEAVRASCERRGIPFEWSFLLDALQVERDQGVTLDCTRFAFALDGRRYVLIDAPGHREFLRNMMTGASSADAALLVLDVREGVKAQSRRHAQLLRMLGISQIAVAVNKMDAVEYSKEAFAAITSDFGTWLETLGFVKPAFIPVSAREGGGIISPSAHMPWYDGLPLADALRGFHPGQRPVVAPFRMPVQDVYRMGDKRILIGRVESGRVKAGDTVLVSPGNQRAQVASVEIWPEGAEEAVAGQSVGLTLSDQLFVERGHMLSHAEQPPFLTNLFHARIFWLAEKPLRPESRLRLHLGTQEIMAEVKSIEGIVDPETLEIQPASSVGRHDMADVNFRVRGLAAVDDFRILPSTGRFAIAEGQEFTGGGVINLSGLRDQRVQQEAARSQNITPVSFALTTRQRAERNGHLPGVFWFTGLSGAGKSTLAQEVQNRLFSQGMQVFVLDGDNLRNRLNRDLGFSRAERHENLRRAAEVAALFADAGFIVLTSFISPTHEDRALARAVVPDYFYSVFIKAELEVCEQRDVKGLYRKARAGEISDFTGISAPYEEPENPDLIIDTATHDVNACAGRLLHFIERQCVEPLRTGQMLDEPEDFYGMGI